MSVDILMATYNGGDFVRNQLLSLQQQTYEDWVLWVRDDGSSDGTMDILLDFASRDRRIQIVEDDSGKGLGPVKNFLGLTKFSTADYGVFCDQDDIWFEKKLEFLLDVAINESSPDMPFLVYCDGYGYSDKLGVISVPSISIAHVTELREILFFNAGYQGCSMLFNKTLCRLAADYRGDFIYMHDDVVSLLAHTFGTVRFLPKKLMLYRQHEKNVTGNIKSGIIYLLKGSHPVISEKHFREKMSFYQAYNEKMSRDQRDIFEAYLHYPFHSLVGRLFVVVRHRFSIGGEKARLLVKTLIRRPIG